MTALRAAAAAALLLCSAAAQAQNSNSPYYIGASQTFTHDSNLLRVTDGTTVPPDYSRADNVSSTALLAGFDQPFGRQRAYANAALRSNRYSNNDRFNNQSYSASGGLDWSTIERISGSVTANANRSLQRYTSEEVGFLTDKNLQTATSVKARASIGMVTQYSLELNGGWQRVRNSLDIPTIKARDYDDASAGFALQWRPSGATTLGAGFSGNRGRYPRFRTDAAGDYQPDRFHRRNIDLTASLRFSGISSFDGRISSGRTRYDLNSARDFSGVTGSAGWTYLPTGKLRFNANFSRDTGQESYATTLSNQPATADYGRVSNSWRLQSSYQASSKIVLTAGLTYADRKLVQTVDNPFVPIRAEGRDRTTVLALGARWTPLRNTALGCDYSNENRRASGPLVGNLTGNTFGCYGQITLQ